MLEDFLETDWAYESCWSQVEENLRTDAAGEGSSGGALLDADGRLIGITTAVGVSRVGVEGIAFAVPVETVSEVLTGLDGV